MKIQIQSESSYFRIYFVMKIQIQSEPSLYDWDDKKTYRENSVDNFINCMSYLKNIGKLLNQHIVVEDKIMLYN